ncbi:hypothetical protein UA08_00484 [Talaromyces atroroseus]|uniref:Uncharacterized protein n=1 Tax=Talaromyces atroroseus TaxID=1441469 RepID=A0A225BCA4_TALAT|nr:hypothetical protein UA08_00484 [Talaromyces atroroseus]OKL64545.1 hypothetical protein UA08_00484 [Talaromyces atroroseus]
MGTQLETSSAVGTTTPKFSRYRSVRRAAAEEQKQCAGEGAPAKSPSASIARSMSRYRRQKPATATTTTTPEADHPPVPALPPSIQVPQPVATPNVSSASKFSGQAQDTRAVQKTRLNGTPNINKPTSIDDDSSDDEDKLSEAEKSRMREEAMRKLTMAERPRTASAIPQASQSKAEHKRASWKDKLGLPNHKSAALPTADSENMDSGTHTLAPGIDAPVSAVNAGERRVLVKYRSSSIKLPVTPTTRVKEIIYSAANCFSERVDPKSAIIVESFSPLGLERPLRRYEHVRDVLNSWSADHANALVIPDSPFAGATQRLELSAVLAAAQPKDAKFQLYHSSKPGKWDKRYITLRADGQVVLSKKSDAKEKDFVNICHMSDFDIYTPTARQISKSIRPPKKICFAIKSQQKSSIFISTENFVHFFATNDSMLAEGFHDAVHGWRSWYLVHVLGVGQKQAEAANANANANGTAKESSTHQRHVSTDSVSYQLGSFKPLIEFGRNIDPAIATAPEKTDSTSSTRDMFLRKKKARDHAPPPSSFPVNVPTLDTNTKPEPLSPTHDDDSPFSPDSLLGRTYSQRQTAQREREAKEAEETGPFLAQGLLKNLSPTNSEPPFSNPSSSSRQNSRSNTIRSHQEGGLSQSRSNSVRQKAKPLVDLTPTYREPPQHVRKGHGVKIDAGIPLVEAATGLEPVPGMPAIPSATTWRREETAARPTTASASAAAAAANESSSASISSRRRANTVKGQQQHHHHYPQNGYASVSDVAMPFMPNGLIALSSGNNNTANAQANSTSIGRGVATGDRHATRPLLDLNPHSQFVEGSLLRNIERNQ